MMQTYYHYIQLIMYINYIKPHMGAYDGALNSCATDEFFLILYSDCLETVYLHVSYKQISRYSYP